VIVEGITSVDYCLMWPLLLIMPLTSEGHYPMQIPIEICKKIGKIVTFETCLKYAIKKKIFFRDLAM
jgi:hypothetical protein